MLIGLILSAIISSAAQRCEVSINDAWSFRRECDTVSRIVSIPHTWNAQDCVDDEPGYWRGVGWYERTVRIDDALPGKKVYVRFEGANQQVDLWVNDIYAGNHRGGYTAFIFDISGLVRVGENTFRVKVDNSHNEAIPPMTADFTFFGGIYRSVSLLFVPENHISVEHFASDGVYITTPEVSSSSATVKIETRLSIPNPANKLFLEQIILAPDGKKVAKLRKQLVKPSGDLVVCAHAVVSSPLLWDTNNPQLYTVVSRLLDMKGGEIDTQINSFGIRSFSFDPEKGFFLNGRHVKLVGTNRHQDFKGMGNALPDEIHINDVQLLKDMGGNFLRISHYPQDRLVSDECDRLGILSSMEIPVIDRIGYAEEFTSNCVNMAKEMVYQYYNHPSMIMWAYMNEVLLRDTPWKKDGISQEKYYGRVRDCALAIDSAIKLSDPSRPTMIPFDSNGKRYKECGLWEVPDIIGLNLYYGWYYSRFEKLASALDDYHKMFPGKPIFITEYGADADSRLHSFEPECQDYTCDFALLFHKKYIPVILDKEYVSGATVWNLNDFHSEARGYAVPHFNLKGLVTSSRMPKDSYWMYKALFGKGPFIHTGESDWKIRGGQEAGGVCLQPVEVYSSSDSVELLLNGQSLGVMPVCNGYASFDVPFTGGYNALEACGSDGVRDRHQVDFRLVPEDMSLFDEICVMLGSKRYFEERDSARIWIPEQEYRPGSWGYVGGDVAPRATANIVGTDSDPVFQTQRYGLEAFRADVPDGRYCVSLYFAELAGDTERKFSVLINGTPVLDDFDIAGSSGVNTSVIRSFQVDAYGGNGLYISFVPETGPAVLNAIRIGRSVPCPN